MFWIIKGVMFIAPSLTRTVQAGWKRKFINCFGNVITCLSVNVSRFTTRHVEFPEIFTKHGWRQCRRYCSMCGFIEKHFGKNQLFSLLKCITCHFSFFHFRSYIIPRPYRISGSYHDLWLIKGMIWKMPCNNLYLSMFYMNDVIV